MHSGSTLRWRYLTKTSLTTTTRSRQLVAAFPIALTTSFEHHHQWIVFIHSKSSPTFPVTECPSEIVLHHRVDRSRTGRVRAFSSSSNDSFSSPVSARSDLHIAVCIRPRRAGLTSCFLHAVPQFEGHSSPPPSSPAASISLSVSSPIALKGHWGIPSFARNIAFDYLASTQASFWLEEHRREEQIRLVQTRSPFCI